MAANGQRIHPADPRSSHVPTPAMPPPRRRAPSTPPANTTPAASGLVACASGARSHEVVAMALEAVARVAHRGAASTDNSGDGAGLLTQIPARLFYRDAYRLGLHLQPGLPFGVGSFFLPRRPDALGASVAMIEEVLAGDGIPFLGWRDVPNNPAALGPTARASCPVIRQVLVGRPALAGDEESWERALYLARREMERRALERNLDGFYVSSLSCRTLVYKALLTGTQLPAFYTDFRYPEYESAIAVFHQRYSTNTLPSWPLAQPFRLLAHNGEINTLWGNRNAMTMRQPMLASPLWGDRIERLRDVIWKEGSDSASLDNAMELLVRSGRDVVHTSMMMIPQAWEKYPDVDPAVKAFYEYHQCVLEPWDGPAALAFTDGVLAGAAVDRNGLRPCRYKVRRDGLVVAGSEVGLVDLDPREVIECGKVGPGEVLVVDTAKGEVIRNLDAKRRVATRRPYARWVARYMATLVPDPARVAPAPEGEELLRTQRAFGYGFEDLRLVLEPMGERRGGPGLEHGGRHAHPAARGVGAECLRLLPPALRAGDQPADRLAAGVHGDVAPDASRPAWLPAAGAAVVRAHAAAGAPHPPGRGDGRAPERSRLLHGDAGRGLGRGPKGARACGRRSPPSGARPSARPGAAPASSSSATGPRTRSAPRSRCCSPSGPSASIWCTRACAPGSASWPRRGTPSTSTTSRP